MNQKVRAGLALLVIALVLLALGMDSQTAREIGTGVGLVAALLLVLGLVESGRHSDA